VDRYGAVAQLPGRIVELDECDYTYGVGRLRLRVGDATPLRSKPGWVMLDGMTVDRDGTTYEPRTIAVRLTALRGHLAGPR
jgi:hypothetical protein